MSATRGEYRKFEIHCKPVACTACQNARRVGARSRGKIDRAPRVATRAAFIYIYTMALNVEDRALGSFAHRFPIDLSRRLDEVIGNVRKWTRCSGKIWSPDTKCIANASGKLANATMKQIIFHRIFPFLFLFRVERSHGNVDYGIIPQTRYMNRPRAQSTSSTTISWSSGSHYHFCACRIDSGSTHCERSTMGCIWLEKPIKVLTLFILYKNYFNIIYTYIAIHICHWILNATNTKTHFHV